MGELVEKLHPTDLVKQLRSSALSYTRGIGEDAIGGKPEHYIQWQAADEIEQLRTALDRAAYALFQIKRMHADAIPRFASDEHAEACNVLNDEQTSQRQEESARTRIASGLPASPQHLWTDEEAARVAEQQRKDKRT